MGRVYWFGGEMVSSVLRGDGHGHRGDHLLGVVTALGAGGATG